MATATQLKKAAILAMMRGYPSSADLISEGTLTAYIEALEDVSPEAVTRSCQQFSRGLVAGHNNGFMPTAAELTTNARQWDAAIASVEASREMRRLGLDLNGIPKVDFGHGPIDTNGLTFAERERLMQLKGIMPDGRNAAFMTLAEKREALKVGKIDGPRPPTPKLKRMSDE